MWKWYKHHAKRRGVGLEINGNVLSRTPFRRINFSDPEDKAAHDRIVILVEAMISLKKHLVSAKSESQKGIIQRQIDATDAEIDRLVYKLYGLTADEIAIVEGEV